jgi:ABC-type branched-subunit amino acid transport system substrate-binding protein
MHSSLSLQALEDLLTSAGILYLYVAPHESEQRTGNLFRLGNSVQAQIDFAIPEVGRRTDARRWYLIGNDYSWPREISRAARERIEAGGGEVVGETYVPLGDGTAFEAIVDTIIASGADAIVSSLIGYSSVDFEREFASRNARARIATLSTLMDEPTLELLGSDADGIWSSLSYFSTLGSPENLTFLQRYNDAFGEWSPPPSVLSAPVYEAVHLFARAAARAQSRSADDIANAIPGLPLGGPRGAIQVSSDGSIHPPMFMARARGGKFIVDKTTGSSRPRR